MSYNVKITYVQPVADPEQRVPTIFPSYAYPKCYADCECYEGTVYDTNVPGWGHIDVEEPYASTAIPLGSALAQFKIAAVGEDSVVEFEVPDYQTAFYYQQMGKQLEEQGFTVEVTLKN